MTEETIRINGITLCHKHSDGFVRSTLPDVCLTPPAPVPVPYTNTAFARDLSKGTRTVRSHGGAMNGVKGSEFSISYGDEPGTAGGVISGVNCHRATWLSWSPNVFMEGRPVTRLTDKMLLNKGNTVSLGGYYTKHPEGTPGHYLCDVGCKCYAKHRPKDDLAAEMEKVPMFLRDDEKTSGRYQRCVRDKVKVDYPNTVFSSTIIEGKPFTGEGYLAEVGYWDPTNEDNEYPKKPPGELIADNNEFSIPIPRPIPWIPGSRRFNYGGSRWMDMVRVSGGKPTHMWDMKFPGDKWPNPEDKDNAYRAIAEKYRAKYAEFVVLDECDQCKTAIDNYKLEKQLEWDRFWQDMKDAARRSPIFFPPIGPRGRRFPVPAR